MSNELSRPFRVACIGGSIRSAVGRAHRIALSMDRKFEVVSGSFSRDHKINIETAESFGVPANRVYEDVDKLLEKEAGNIDAALIITPTDLHFEQVEKCLQKKVFVICEKALATSVQEILRLKEIMPKGHFDLAVVYNYLGYPMLRELKHLIEVGRLGKIHQIHIEMPQEGFAKLKKDNTPMVPQSWRLRDPERVSFVSLDLGVHVHSIIRYLTGLSPERLVAKCDSLGNFSDIIDNVNCLASYEEGLVANIWYGKVALGRSNGLSVRVLGEIGSAEWVQQYPEELALSDVYGNRTVIDRGNNSIVVASESRYARFKVGHPAGFIEALANFYWDVAILMEKKAAKQDLKDFDIYSLDTALEGLKMMETINSSAETQQWESMQEGKVGSGL
ncbi:MAG: Gfo/Idh/MocA family oxidoreductase [Bdellovibrionales bacterium]|nr:Gfo/Idh/MocA family oxidoreductase [Bdellovibrionales bacterium]